MASTPENAGRGSASSDKLPALEAPKGTTTLSFMRASSGPFTLPFYKRLLEKIQETGSVLTLSVSSGIDERVFFFTRGAILFLATGTSGGHLLERKILAKGLLPKEKLAELRSIPGRERPILQEALRESRLLEDAKIQGLVEECIEEQLLELALWDNELGVYDIIPGNPPTRIYDKRAPSIRLSIGLRAMLAKVIPKVADIPDKILRPLGGSLKARIKPVGSPKDSTGDPVQDAVLQQIPAMGRSGLQIVAGAQKAGTPAYAAAIALGALVAKKRIQVELGRDLTREEQTQVAVEIEGGMESFVNRLIARQHLAKIYEKLDDKEKAGDHLREISNEYIERDRIDDAVDTLQKALGLVPNDLAAREGLVKVLTLAKRPGDAAKEAMDLGQMLLELKLPGRAKNAFSLAAKLLPRSLEVLWKLASLSETLGDKEEAIRRYEEIAELARQADDKAGVVSAKQRILSLDPKNKVALKTVRSLSGFQAAVALRAVTAGTALVVAAVLIGSSLYELEAAEAWHQTSFDAWSAFDRGQDDAARTLVGAFEASWRHSSAARHVGPFLDRLEHEAHLRSGLAAAAEARSAQALEAQGKLAEAVTHWQAALDVEREPDRKAVAQAAIARCQAALADVADARRRARELVEKGDGLRARDLLAGAIERNPWLAIAHDTTVPCRIETVPSNLKVSVDGHELPGQTPKEIERPAVAGELVVFGDHGERVIRELPALPPWPFVVALPRPALWVRPELQAAQAPALGDGTLVTAGRDRAVSVVKRATGELVWRRSLGVFGDVDATPVIAGRLVLARSVDGAVHALDLASGAERWTAHPRPGPSTRSRPVACAAGIAVLEGARTVVLLRASDGAVRWRQVMPDDVVGDPVVALNNVVVAHGRALRALETTKGATAWEVTLPAPLVLGPALGPRSTLYAALKGQLVRVDFAGMLLGEAEPIRDPITALEADEQHIVVGTAPGEVLTLDSRGKLDYRRFVATHPVTWVLGAAGLVLASDGSALYALDPKLGELWRDVSNGSPAAADSARVYLVGSRGLAAVERENK